MQANSLNPIRLVLKPLVLALALVAVQPVQAVMVVQCKGPNGSVNASEDLAQPSDPNKQCMHLTASDGFAHMADGTDLYTFGFFNLTGHATAEAIDRGTTSAQSPAPTIELQEGKDFFLTLSNVGFALRPDLVDPHTIHFHGFPQAAPVFDGMPEGSFGINMNASQTYYYKLRDPGTYLYHCHQEATEHMAMGMIGNLYVHPLQNGVSTSYSADGGLTSRTYSRFAYNDDPKGPGNISLTTSKGITGYTPGREYPLQFNSFDKDFHEANLAVQALPFATLHVDYPMINGRGYPDTVNPATTNFTFKTVKNVPDPERTFNSQPMSSRVEAVVGERVLLRLSNLSITDYMTIQSPSIDMLVVGAGAAIARGPSEVDAANPIYPAGSKPVPKDRFYATNSVTLGGGEAYDVILDTAGVAPGTYFLYTANLQYLSNLGEDYGGAMTEIVISAAPAP